MALYPAARKKLIAPGSNDPAIKARVAILHVAVSTAASLFSFFKYRSGGIESHFYVTLLGKVEQYRDTGFEADANHLANPFAISIETAGFGAGKWNKRQLRAIKALLLWLHETHDIPLQRCPQWDGAGVGYHVQFGAPGKWTPVAKSCPGPERIKQFYDVLVPWMRKASKPAAVTAEAKEAPAPVPEIEELDVNPDDYINIHGPNKGRLETRGLTWREKAIADVIHILHGRRAAKKFLLEAKKTRGQ